MDTMKAILVGLTMMMAGCTPAEILGDVGDVCVDDADCMSGYCVEFASPIVPDGKRCRQYCDPAPENECPDSAICAPASSVKTDLPVCVPLR